MFPVTMNRLIPAVEARPPLWDTRHRHYRNVHKKDALWREVAQQLHAYQWRSATPEQRAEFVVSVQRSWKSARDQYRREARQAQTSTHLGKKPYKYSPLLAFLDILMDVGPSTSNWPGITQSQQRGQQRTEQQQLRAGSSPLVRQPARHRTQITDDTSDSETSVRNRNTKVPDQQRQQAPPAHQGQRSSLSPCSRVDQAVLRYLRGREGADWAELYCASLVPSFRALPPHIIPKMKVAVETLFESALGAQPTDECFWLLARWSLHGRGRFPNRDQYSTQPPGRAVNPVEHGAEPVSDFSPFRESLLSPQMAPHTTEASALQPMGQVNEPAAIHESKTKERLTWEVNVTPEVMNTDNIVPDKFCTSLNVGPTPQRRPKPRHRPILPPVKWQRQAASMAPKLTKTRHGWETTSSEEGVEPNRQGAKQCCEDLPTCSSAAFIVLAPVGLGDQGETNLALSRMSGTGTAKDIHAFFKRHSKVPISLGRGGKQPRKIAPISRRHFGTATDSD
ncbi:uncharacterized protein [Eleutherodactylus coqui]|uniref:uncharacterized protein n=1 Tax=Eleutherodactylus coqui TaxID=57060 RepID=UPI0034623FA7